LCGINEFIGQALPVGFRKQLGVGIYPVYVVKSFVINPQIFEPEEKDVFFVFHSLIVFIVKKIVEKTFRIYLPGI
jgi:hypothetical protein